MSASKPQFEERSLKRLQDEFGDDIMTALYDSEIDEIMLNPDGHLFFEVKGSGIQDGGVIDKLKAQAIVRTVASITDTVLDNISPVVSCALPFNQERFEGLLPPLVSNPIFCIRKHNALYMSLTELQENGMFTLAEQRFLKEALKTRRSILVVGATSCGKTTLVNALLNEIKSMRPQERLIILEDTPELSPTLLNQVRLCSDENNDMSALLKSSLRLRPDTIVVGEVRGAEALDLVDALTTGHEGGIATVHAGSIAQALKRMTMLISRHQSAPRMIESLLVSALDLIVLLKRHPQRHIACISEVTDFNHQEFSYHNLFSKTGELYV